MLVIEYINKNSKIAVSDAALLFKISIQAALKEIGKLVKMDVIKREGQGRASYYVMR